MVVILPTRDGHRGQPIRNHNDADRYTGRRRACGDHGRVEKVVGCLLGRTSLGLLTVERFFLPEALRQGFRNEGTAAGTSKLHFRRE